MDETRVDLVVVGGEICSKFSSTSLANMMDDSLGGPTGILTALLAKRLGVSVLVLGRPIPDAKPQPLQLGRADALNARSQQYLEIVGILDDLISQGLKCNTSSTFTNGGFASRQSHWWTGLQHVLHKNFLMIGQPVVEQLLAAELKESLLYNERVESIRETECGVEVATISQRIVHGTYCIASDGARSMVRQALRIPFTGTKPEMLWAVLDTFIDSDFPRCPEIITFELDGESRVAWIPRERGLARFYILLDGEVTEEKSKASIKRHLAPYRVDFTKTEWFSTFEVKERIAETFISQNGNGRIILAGDAAHCHAVNGGQGLNTGLSDAFSLGWRMAYILKYSDKLAPGAANRILQSYDAERRKVAENVIRVAARLVRDIKYEATQYVGNVEKNANYITGMGIAYHDLGSPAVRESEVGIWKAGRACPDILLTTPGASESRYLYSIVTYGKYMVLVAGDHGGHFNTFKSLVRWLRILPKADEQNCHLNGESELSYLAEVVKEGENYAIVVRPDMYIAYAGTAEGATEYLAEIFVS
ncbi:FAD monooxygenase [Coccidioides immitis RS]|uniref:FAD monooxygenase n=1 Tax=Coccidioides immitis (strain RS) TaxID=246410 RepID=J3KGE4_COCIM|nr:FAD monooxygenase [Coccidioides immitis RS]EAS34804.3 FAD monooxygenase [Coccidioides immitis RS]